MALPSGFTLLSAAAVVAAGVWLATSASGADQEVKRTSDPSGAASHASTPRGGASSTHGGGRHQRPPQQRVVPKVLIEIYNNSGVTGLAESGAAVLRGAGWSVAGVDDWHGDIPADTVYYPPQLGHAANQLAAVLHIDRLRPAVAPMKFDRLTVIYSRP
jgi:hypothetical protein